MKGRREVIKAGLAAVAGAHALGAWAADKSKDEPKAPAAPLMTKPVPSTGERLAVIGVGTNNYSPTTPEERAARREVLKNLTAAGASIIDTAPAYRQSEEVIGDLLTDLGAQAIAIAVREARAAPRRARCATRKPCRARSARTSGGFGSNEERTRVTSPIPAAPTRIPTMTAPNIVHATAGCNRPFSPAAATTSGASSRPSATAAVN